MNRFERPECSPTPLRAILLRTHEELDKSFVSLIEAFRADPRSVGLYAWRAFEVSLLDHLRTEEEALFPAFERTDPALIATLRAEHDAIRRHLDTLGVGVELHSVQADFVALFVDTLRKHAAREDAGLYGRIDSVLSTSELRSLCDRLLVTTPASPLKDDTRR